jgi:hypothetical protein
MRQRENSYGLNTAMKFKILQTNNITKDESKRKENYDQLEEYAGSNLSKKEGDSIENFHNIPMHPIKPEFQKRFYLSKGKPLKFHENASIVKLNPSDLGEINSSQKQVNFLTLMAMFDESELNEIDMEQLLGVNFEKYGTLKEKLGRIIEYVKSAQGEGKNEALGVLNNKMNQIDNDIRNIDNISSNIENIDKIIYGTEETKVVFQMK